MPRLQYPKTKRQNIVETIHGHQVEDPYRWLEASDGSEVKSWSKAQNRLTDRVIANELQTKLRKDIKHNFYFDSVWAPTPYQGRYFWKERKANQDLAVLYTKVGLKGKKSVVVDPNKLHKSSSKASMDFWAPSPSGSLLAYGISYGGDEKPTMKIMDVKTGEHLKETIPNCLMPSISWLSDESGFYYKRNPKPGTVAKHDERFYSKVYLHKIGDNPENDPLIFGRGRPKDDMLAITLSLDDRWLLINASQGWVSNDLFLYDAKKKSLKPLITGKKAQFVVTFSDQTAFMWTDYQAPNGKLLSMPVDELSGDLKKWNTFLPEHANQPLQWHKITKSKVLAFYLENATEQVHVYDFYGRKLNELPVPEQGGVLDVTSRRQEEEFFFDVVNFVTPGITYRYNPQANKYVLYHKMPSTIKSSEFRVKQEWYKSKDGMKVPMFIVHHKRVRPNGKNPTILTGYGGFGSSHTPGYLRANIPWLRRGGVYAIANIRGGGEFGKKWHTSAILRNKQKSYDDFIGAAMHLISCNYTSSQQLGIVGGSNGGLLVAAVAMQRPELYRAVVSEVPLLDMVRFPKLLIASRWVTEYGDPAKPQDLPYILKYSPYHNVKEGVEYPSFLFTTAVNDTRVDPMHARKMAALLQSTHSAQPVLLYVEDDAGHTGSITMSRFFRNHARILAFFAQTLGLKV